MSFSNSTIIPSASFILIITPLSSIKIKVRKIPSIKTVSAVNSTPYKLRLDLYETADLPLDGDEIQVLFYMTFYNLILNVVSSKVIKKNFFFGQECAISAVKSGGTSFRLSFLFSFFFLLFHFVCY